MNTDKIIKEIEDLTDYYEREISKEQKERDKQWKHNPISIHFELKAKLSQRLSDCEEELKFLENELIWIGEDDELDVEKTLFNLKERATSLKSEIKLAKEFK